MCPFLIHYNQCGCLCNNVYLGAEARILTLSNHNLYAFRGVIIVCEWTSELIETIISKSFVYKVISNLRRYVLAVKLHIIVVLVVESSLSAQIFKLYGRLIFNVFVHRV